MLTPDSSGVRRYRFQQDPERRGQRVLDQLLQQTDVRRGAAMRDAADGAVLVREHYACNTTCSSKKTRYMTIGAARSAANMARLRGIRLRVYCCTLCLGHHLTSQG